jgi:4'-phosphopantetheinyl transferase
VSLSGGALSLPRPGPGEVLVVIAQRPTETDGIADAGAGLAPDDLARAVTMAHDGKRRAFLAGRMLARAALAAATGRAGASLVLVADVNGRLDVDGEPGHNVRFSITHGRVHDAVAVALGVRVGIDVEEFAPPDRDGVAETVISAVEFAEFDKLAPQQRDRAFPRLWTRKEAVMKAAGVGFLVYPRGFDVGVADGPAVVLAGAGGLPGGPWFVVDLPGEVPGAVAVEGSGGRCSWCASDASRGRRPLHAGGIDLAQTWQS